MEYNNEPLSIYDKLEQISPQAPFDEYLQLIKEMRNEKLSVRDCITTIAERNINQQKSALEKEWHISPQHWNDIETIKNNILQQDKQGITATINFDENFPSEHNSYFTPERIQSITNLFNDAGYKKSVNITFAEPVAEKGGIRTNPIALSRTTGTYSVNAYPIDIDQKKLNTKVFIATPYTIKLQPIFFRYSMLATQGHWFRTITVPVSKGCVGETLLFFSACIEHPELIRDGTPFYTSHSLINMRKVVAAATDQITASISNAHAKCYQKTLEETLGIYAEAQEMYGKAPYDPKHEPLHASLYDRIVTIKRIVKLKEAEEFLNTNQ